jgi:hypothetical protein
VIRFRTPYVDILTKVLAEVVALSRMETDSSVSKAAQEEASRISFMPFSKAACSVLPKFLRKDAGVRSLSSPPQNLQSCLIQNKSERWSKVCESRVDLQRCDWGGLV